MKKTTRIFAVFLIGLCALLNFSCTSTGISDPELFKGNTYTLKIIYFSTDISIEDKETALYFVENLPVQKIAEQIFDTYNITLDTQIFTHDYLSENLKAAVSTNEAGQQTIIGWNIENPDTEGKSVEEAAPFVNGMAKMVISLNTMGAYYNGLNVLTSMFNNANEVLPHLYSDAAWTPVPYKVNKDNAAVLEFSKYIEPSYLIIDDQIVIYSAYHSANSAGNSAVYVDTDKIVKIITKVKDPGIIMLYDPTTFINCEIEGEYKPGKTYSVKHKVTDRLKMQWEWKVNFEIEEK